MRPSRSYRSPKWKPKRDPALEALHDLLKEVGAFLTAQKRYPEDITRLVFDFIEAHQLPLYERAIEPPTPKHRQFVNARIGRFVRQSLGDNYETGAHVVLGPSVHKLIRGYSLIRKK